MFYNVCAVGEGSVSVIIVIIVIVDVARGAVSVCHCKLKCRRSICASLTHSLTCHKRRDVERMSRDVTYRLIDRRCVDSAERRTEHGGGVWRCHVGGEQRAGDLDSAKQLETTS